MANLLHEYWENQNGGEFGPVRERADQLRSILTPGARLVFSVHASSWHQAMRMHNDRLGYGEYQPTEGVPDHFYSEEEVAEQDAYLTNRTVR
ncbi:hypothetical protein HL653_15730 [Sphingomonas sp. AP4-R1]|uniref:hypothetical protein n=1 Tax=Sphingomonas sp. AP4-R1 TaxID=2735134 RepID=UPI00149345FE|nr:hypothetical protein [Sphingomonas sp. AP4-R1]QJU59021.1 hypothetical protein HL653_15730 [Sphingomonas sp. AP4-R1]